MSSKQHKKCNTRLAFNTTTRCCKTFSFLYPTLDASSALNVETWGLPAACLFLQICEEKEPSSGDRKKMHKKIQNNNRDTACYPFVKPAPAFFCWVVFSTTRHYSVFSLIASLIDLMSRATTATHDKRRYIQKSCSFKRSLSSLDRLSFEIFLITGYLPSVVAYWMLNLISSTIFILLFFHWNCLSFTM